MMILTMMRSVVVVVKNIDDIISLSHSVGIHTLMHGWTCGLHWGMRRPDRGGAVAFGSTAASQVALLIRVIRVSLIRWPSHAHV
jgi:hypothetical protein